jgi:YVTN family beta-propeller protein
MRRRPRDLQRDLGLTLVELLISIVLTTIIGGVISAALITSMNAASSTAAQASDSTDAQLIAAYLTRDAQAAGGTDPATAQLVADLGVSTAATTVGWAGCQQSGTMVVRFSWIDRGSALGTTPVVVTYALAGDGSLTRRACEGATQTDVVLGRRIVSATATCSPGGVCTGLPDQVTLTVRGGAAATPFDYTLTASLRGDSQTSPTSVNSSQAPLVVTRTTTCPVLSVTSTGTVFVRGDAVIAAGCGASPTTGDLTKLSVSGATTLPTAVSDAFATLSPPSSTCGSGVNPTIGTSAGAGAVNVYPQAVTVTGAVVFQPGRYVFCNGLAIAAGATVSGTDVLWYVADGAVSVASTATVDVAPATTGTYANLVLWAAGTQGVTITNGATVDELRGMVYVPRAAVAVSSTAGTRLGGLFAATASFSGGGPTRLGVPSPTLTVAATQLPDAGTGTAYTATAPSISGGTSPYTYTASGLPPGVSLSSAGALSGSPTASGAYTVSFVAVDATGASVAFSRSLTVGGAPAGCPSTTTGWWGQYWTNNSLTGTAALCRADASLSFDWGTGSPDPSIPVDNFSARWTRTADFAAGDYTFTAGSDDGLRLYIDGTLVLDRWTTRALTYDSITRTLTAGSHTIVMETFEAGGTAGASLTFGIAAPVTCPGSIIGWRAEYFSNKSLSGAPTACQDDAAINFDWATGKPAVLPNSDNFGVRWTRTQQFLAGTYTFQVGGDDGVRLYLDGVMVVDSWVDTAYAVRTYTGAVTAGAHTVVMEFYENGGYARATLAWSVNSVPGAPTNLTVAPGDTTATATWAQGVTSGEPATTTYTVTATASGQTTRTCTSVPPATTCTLTGLVNAVTYAVSVTASNSVGVSAAATTTATPRPAVLGSTGLQLWLDASDPDGDGVVEGAAENCATGVSCTTAVNVLTRWEDKSGKDHDAVQSVTAKAGTFVSGLPAVNFDANGWYNSTVSVGPDTTVFVVAQSDTSTWNQYGWLFAARGANGVILHPWPGGNLVGWYAVNSAGSYTYLNQVAVTTLMAPHIYDITEAGSNPIVASGSFDGSSVGNVSVASQRTAGGVTLWLGADDTGGDRLGDGKYREVLMFDRALSAAERRSVQEYLARRWTVAITPAAPAAPTVAPGNGTVAVSWTAPSWDGGSAVTGYTVTTSPGGATCTATAPATTCTVSGLANGTAYTFTVTATNAVGTSAASAASPSATPGPPPAPTGVSGSVADSSSVVTWTAPTITSQAAVTSYTVTATASGQTTRTCTATAPAVTCTVTGLTNYVAYTLSVTATNAGGTSAAATATVTPDWTPANLGSALTWWFDANDPSALTGAWATQSGYTVSGSAGSTRLTVSSGVVERLDITAGGTGYTSSPSFTFSGGGGSGASVYTSTVSGGAVTSVVMAVRGTGYSSEPTVTVSSGGGAGARVRAQVVAAVPVGATIRVAGQTYTVTDRDGLVLTVSPALAANASAATIDMWSVSNWQNRTTPGTRDAKQTSASDQPELGAIGARPAVVFDGMSSWMWLLDDTGGQTFDHGPGWTILIAYQAERQLGWGALSQTVGTNTRIVASSSGATSDWQTAENIQVNPDQGTDASTGGPVRIVTLTGNGTDTFNWTRLFLGASAAPGYTSGWNYAGRIGEIIFVNAGMNSTDVAKAQAYLTQKWTQATVVPSAPIGVRASAGDTQAVVTWRAANAFTSTISGYTVTATSPGRTTQTCTTTGALTCTLTGLTNGAAYTVSVTATTAVGTGPASVSATVIPAPALLTSASSKVWLDATDLDGDGRVEGVNAEDGLVSGAVQTWADKSGQSNSVAAPTTAERPSANTQVVNGLPVVAFNGSTVLYGSTASNPYGITGDRTMFVVSRMRTSGVTATYNVIDRTVGDNPLFSITGGHQLQVRDDAGGQSSNFGRFGPTLNATDILVAGRSGSVVSYWNDSRSPDTVTLSGTQTMRGLAVGRHQNRTTTASWDIAEVIVFNRALTSAERRQVEDYLQVKWASPIAPDAPTGVTATNASGTVTVSWTAPVSNGGSAITGYTATASPGGATCTTTGTSCTISGLASGSYTFTVAATNAVGTGSSSAASSSVTIQSLPLNITTTRPDGIIYDGTSIWVTNDTASTVSRINTSTNAVEATITVGSGPTQLAFDGTYIWVTNANSNTVSKINRTTNTVAATVTVGTSPVGIAYDGTSIWVANFGSRTLSKINPSTNAVGTPVSFSGSPRHMTYANGSLWIGFLNNAAVMRFNTSTNTSQAVITVGNSPYDVLSDGTYIWVANYNSSSVSKINPATNSVVGTVAMGSAPYGLAYANSKVWVTLNTAGTVRSIDPATLALGTAKTVGSSPFSIASNGDLWVANYSSNTVTRLAAT